MDNYSIDALLGNFKNRYFGNGYKKIFHDVKLIDSKDGIHWLANISISKYINWSIKK
ncbi:hypothetical protein [Fructilactobacillus florum]|uniref:hypothetical protein n=1 Tax=Fructilactobacillus florum TaxID=640331 RepID=UPI000A8212B3|nr:hypothetical protein [Fructilactobacillus florum]